MNSSGLGFRVDRRDREIKILLVEVTMVELR